MAISTRCKTVIDHILAQQRIANAYLFYGTQGSLVPVAATHFAQALLCDATSPTPKPCQTCQACQQVANGTHPDYSDISAEKRLTIDQVRAIRDRIKYGPAQSRHLVVIIRRVDTLTTQAANAFLKTLEEPPKGVVFILTTTQILDVLSTIKSRSQQWFVDPPTHDQISEWANHHLKTESSATQTIPDHLLGYCVDSNFIPETPLIPFSQLASSPVHNRMQLAQELGKNPPHAALQLLAWSQETTTPPQVIALIIEIIGRMKYNLNLKLQMEALFLKIGEA